MTHKVEAKFSLVLIGSLLLPIPTSTSAQSLGKVARQYRKEREARKKKGEVPVRIFTNDDVARMPPVATLSSSHREPLPPEKSHAAPPQPPETASVESPAGSPAVQPGKTEDTTKSKEYWQARFKSAHAALAQTKEEQTLVEDELRLLQIQQARELDPNRSRKLSGQIDAASAELEAKRAATQKARATLDEIEKEFKKSGAPQNWIQNEKGPDGQGAKSPNLSAPGAGPPRRR